jgi:hypothetical protein
MQGANFLNLSFYVAGGGLPNDSYCLFFDVRLHAYVDAQGVQKGEKKLGVMVTAYPLSSPTEEHKKEQFYAMGTNAHKSWAPHPQTGKSVVPIPGGPGQGLSNMSNWSYLFKSMIDCGLPAEYVDGKDLTALDGIHIHTMQIDEPEERKNIQSVNTGEAAEGPRRSGKIAVCSEILASGMPWNNTGGIPKSPIVNGSAAAVGAQQLQQSTNPTSVAPAPASAPDIDLAGIAADGITAVLTVPTNANGCPKILLRTQTFAAVKKLHGDQVANDVINNFFTSDDALNSVLGTLGYTASGAQVKVAG